MTTINIDYIQISFLRFSTAAILSVPVLFMSLLASLTLLIKVLINISLSSSILTLINVFNILFLTVFVLPSIQPKGAMSISTIITISTGHSFLVNYR